MYQKIEEEEKRQIYFSRNSVSNKQIKAIISSNAEASRGRIIKEVAAFL